MKVIKLFEDFDPYKENLKKKKTPLIKGVKNNKVVKLKNWAKY